MQMHQNIHGVAVKWFGIRAAIERAADIAVAEIFHQHQALRCVFGIDFRRRDIERAQQPGNHHELRTVLAFIGIHEDRAFAGQLQAGETARGKIGRQRRYVGAVQPNRLCARNPAI